MSKYYPSDYYSLGSFSPRGSNKSIKRAIKKRIVSYAILNKGIIGKIVRGRRSYSLFLIMSQVDLTKKSAILDVGCGSGILLYNLRESGFDNLLGIDPYSREKIEYENGLEILKKTIHEIDGEFDVIMFHHSFEHIPDPIKTFQSIVRLLSKNGTCLIRIPTVSSFAWEHYGVNWVSLDAPRHFFLHSIRSMKLLAEKENLRLKRVMYDSSAFQFWGSEQYVRDIPLRDSQSYAESPSKSIFSKSEIRHFQKRAEKLNRINRGDQAAFFLTNEQ
ncbi:MAG: class I SAM-dependent methyltransferase [Candidatus Hodarchaeales archaeon]|jgi:SAM-dependent methyltransferase